jgi:U3 small nucleolar RNA-associated protein 12
MSDDVMCVRFSHSTDPSKRLLFVASLDSTIKVFFDDSLKFFLSLYGHKLPVLAFDSSSDDTILASGGADKSIKIWGLDFGDTHRSLYGHDDSITDLRFVKRTHNFFTCSKDCTVRFWDGDKFHQILLLRGHASEVNSLAVSSNGTFVLSGGMDRQIRVYERTKDIVFLDLKLPLLNGLETCRAIHKIDPKIVVVLITAFRQEMKDVLEQALKECAYCCLYKPFKPQDVVDIMKAVTRQ